MSKRYYEYTEAERVALSSEETFNAVKIEAISRGIRPPVPLRDIITRQAGFQIPADAIKVYEIAMREGPYSSPEPTGMCFTTEEEAIAASKGAFMVKRSYSQKGDQWALYSGDVCVLTKFIGACNSVDYSKPLNACDDGEPSEEFDKLSEECRDDQLRLRQEVYNREVRARKRTEYVQLAKGDLEVAAAFWRKVESGEFPNEVGE